MSLVRPRRKESIEAAAPEQRKESTEAAAPEPVFTGEQVIEGATPERIWEDHQARYAFSIPFAVGRKALDAACGSGYGSFSLASQGATEVVGVDISERALGFAKQRYQHANLRYEQADVTHLPFENAAFDVVTSFETIEHVDDAGATLAELTRVLVARGILLISTPNRTVTSPSKARSDPPDNRFHRVEYTPPEFDDLLQGSFRVLGRYGQRIVPGILYNPLVMRFGRKIAPYGYAPKHGSPLPAPLIPGWEARYLLYVCQKL